MALKATGLAIGLAIDQGKVRSFDKQIKQYESVYLPKTTQKL
ncbi:hypothetical protein [Pseudoalteromonas citrea]|nr:hypothetical protein [Pseudoalteromonas citrea]